jgi:hypothetical protein
MTLEEYNKSRPREIIVYQDEKIVIRVNIGKADNEVHLFIHSKSKDGYEQLPLGYMLGSNALMYKIKETV